MRLIALAPPAVASALVIVLGVALTACGGGAPPESTPIAEAYRRMDRGENARAILLLEKFLETNPEHAQARTLLASAYLGAAGVDVYSLHDSFGDVIFGKALGDSFWSDSGGSAKPKSGIARAKEEPQATEETETARALDRLDSALITLKKTVAFLSRFPDVPESKWKYLDEALRLLKELPADRGIGTYRIFIRVTYLKAYLGQRLIKNSELGTRAWACGLDLHEMGAGLEWMLDHLTLASDDYNLIFPDRAGNLNRVHAVLDALLQDLQHNGLSPVPGMGTGLIVLQKELRRSFHCESPGEKA